MNNETLIEVVQLIDNRLAEVTEMLESNVWDAKDWRFLEGTKFALNELKEHLGVSINAGVNQVENVGE
jgi:hypothetical protein